VEPTASNRGQGWMAGCVAAMALIACTSCTDQRGGSASRAVTISVDEVSGARHELSSIPDGLKLRLNPLTTDAGGATELDVDTANVDRVVRKGSFKVWTVDLRTGDRVEGRLLGSLEGLGADGPSAIPWDGIQEAAFDWADPAPVFQPPPGLWAKVHGDGVQPLEVHDLTVQQAWIVSHGTHGYRRDTKVSEILPLTVPRERVVASEWDIPIRMVKRIDVFTGTTGVTVDLGSGEEIRLDGTLGSEMRKYEGDVYFKGTSAIGRWSLSVLKMRRAVIAVAGQLQATRHQPAKISIDVFGRGQPAAEMLDVEPLGTLTDWDDETYQVVDTWFEQLTLKTETGTRDINPADVVAIRVFESPWPAYDQRSLAPQWLEAEVVLADKSRLAGSLLDRFGHVSCVGPGSIIVHFPSYAIRRLELRGE